MAMFSVVFLFIFHYVPLIGVLLAFKEGDYSLNILQAIVKTKWTLDNVISLLNDDAFWNVFKNTIGLNSISFLINFPAPIIFALLINEVKSRRLKNTIQTIANFPHFISWVVFGGIIIALTDMTTGVVNPILNFLHLSSKDNPVDLNLAQYFWAKMIIVSLIKNVGWGSIIYSAAISGISRELYEAAEIDGANRWDKVIRITLPLIAPTIVVYLLLNISRLLGNSFEQFYVFQTTANISKSQVLSTYIYSTGFTYRRYSSAAFMNLFDGLVSVTLLLISNTISKKTAGRGLFNV